jgi:hypothetical protein
MELQRVRKGPQDRVWPWPVFSVREIRLVLAAPEHSGYDTVSMILTNDSGKEILLWSPAWESAEVEALRPFGSAIHLPEGPSGWEGDVWDTGREKVTLAPGHSCLCWIVLVRPGGDDLAERLKKENTGTLIFPVHIEGNLYEVPIKL